MLLFRNPQRSTNTGFGLEAVERRELLLWQNPVRKLREGSGKEISKSCLLKEALILHVFRATLSGSALLIVIVTPVSVETKFYCLQRKAKEESTNMPGWRIDGVH